MELSGDQLGLQSVHLERQINRKGRVSKLAVEAVVAMAQWETSTIGLHPNSEADPLRTPDRPAAYSTTPEDFNTRFSESAYGRRPRMT